MNEEGKAVVVIRQVSGLDGRNTSEIFATGLEIMFEFLGFGWMFDLHPFESLQKTLKVGADVVVTNLGSTEQAVIDTVRLAEKLVSESVDVIVTSSRPWLLEEYNHILPKSVGEVIPHTGEARVMLQILRTKLGI